MKVGSSVLFMRRTFVTLWEVSWVRAGPYRLLSRYLSAACAPDTVVCVMKKNRVGLLFYTLSNEEKDAKTFL
jgi:hypothetical protein